MKRGGHERNSLLHTQKKTSATTLLAPCSHEVKHSFVEGTKNNMKISLKCLPSANPVVAKIQQTKYHVLVKIQRQILNKKGPNDVKAKSKLSNRNDDKVTTLKSTHSKILPHNNTYHLSLRNNADDYTDIVDKQLSIRQIDKKSHFKMSKISPRTTEKCNVQANSNTDISDHKAADDTKTEEVPNCSMGQDSLYQTNTSYVTVLKPKREIEGDVYKSGTETSRTQSMPMKSLRVSELSAFHSDVKEKHSKLEYNPAIVIPGSSILERLRKFSLALKMSSNRNHALRKKDAILNACNEILDAVGIISASNSGERYCVDEFAGLKSTSHPQTITNHIIKARTSRKLHDKLFLLRHLLQMLRFNDGTDMIRKDSVHCHESDGSITQKRATGKRLSVASAATTASLSRTVVLNFKYSHAVAEALKDMYSCDLPEITKPGSRTKSRYSKTNSFENVEVTNLIDICAELKVPQIQKPIYEAN